MGKLILIRHGETNKNINKKLHAFHDTETLNSKGIEQIKLTAGKLTSYSPEKIYSSKEPRALESAQILSNCLTILLEEIEGIEERNWGIFTGKPWEEVKKVLDPMTLDERYTYVPQGGESWKTFEARLINAITKIVIENLHKTAVIVTHGGAIRALMPFLLGLPKEESFKYDPDNASLTIFDYNANGFKKITINDTSHLG